MVQSMLNKHGFRLIKINESYLLHTHCAGKPESFCLYVILVDLSHTSSGESVTTDLQWPM